MFLVAFVSGININCEPKNFWSLETPNADQFAPVSRDREFLENDGLSFALAVLLERRNTVRIPEVW